MSTHNGMLLSLYGWRLIAADLPQLTVGAGFGIGVGGVGAQGAVSVVEPLKGIHAADNRLDPLKLGRGAARVGQVGAKLDDEPRPFAPHPHSSPKPYRLASGSSRRR